MGLMKKYTMFYTTVKWLTSSSTSASLLSISSERPWNVGTLWKKMKRKFEVLWANKAVSIRSQKIKSNQQKNNSCVSFKRMAKEGVHQYYEINLLISEINSEIWKILWNLWKMVNEQSKCTQETDKHNFAISEKMP